MRSMTAIATLSGNHDGTTWAWDLRSVNAKGLDLRLRLPEGCEPLEPILRKALGNALTRGAVTLGLRVKRGAVARAQMVNSDAAEAALEAVKTVQALADKSGVALAPLSPAELLSQPGVMDSAQPDDGPLLAAIGAQIPALLDAFVEMRMAEGVALKAVLVRNLNDVADLLQAANAAAEARQARTGELMRTRLKAALEVTDLPDEDRLAQELALIAVKADVTEELDRLNAHVAAAQELLAADGPIGRRFDFLMQEFNREANTLCSKSGSTDLTNIGLSLKVLIDQMREQVQNVE